MKPTQKARPLTPDDPRHGTSAGAYAHKRHGVPICEPCRIARNEDRRQRYNDDVLGRRRTYPPQGFRRRVEALQALGWSLNTIADRLDTTVQTVRSGAFDATYISAARHIAMVKLFRQMSMTVPSDRFASRRRSIALRKGYVPPLAWDDIDNDDNPVDSSFTEPVIDEVKVQRVLDGIRQDCTRAERIAIVHAWTGTTNELERITGWNVRRILNQGKAA